MFNWFGPKTADQIVSGFSKTISQLEKSAAYFGEQAAYHKQDAETSWELAKKSLAESDRAKKIAAKFNELFS